MIHNIFTLKKIHMLLKTTSIISLVTLFSLSHFSFSMKNEQPFKAVTTKNYLIPTQTIIENNKKIPIPFGQKQIIYLYKNNDEPIYLSHNKHAICCVAHNNTCSEIATGSKDKNIIIWNALTGKKKKILKGHTGPILELFYTTNNNTIISSSYDGTIKQWHPQSGVCLGTLTGHQGPVFAISKNDQDNSLVSGAEDTTIKIWNLKNDTCIGTLKGHTKRVITIMIKNTIIASGSFDNTVKIWDSIAKTCLYTLSSLAAPIYQVIITDENHILANFYNSITTTWIPTDSKQKIRLNSFTNDPITNIIYVPEIITTSELS